MRERGPRSELFMRVDIENMLDAIDSAASVVDNIPARDAHLWRQGFCAAIVAMRKAFDVEGETTDGVPGRSIRA